MNIRLLPLLVALLASPIPALAQGFPPGSTVNFGQISVGTSSGQQLVAHVLFYPGGLNSLEFTLGGDFRPGPSTTCPYPGIFIPPGSGSCDFYVEFAPTGGGSRTGQLVLIAHNCGFFCFDQNWNLTGVGLSSSPPPPPGLAMYDDFAAPQIDPAKWLTQQGGNHVEETVRGIEAGGLRLMTRVYGGTVNDSGTDFEGFFVHFSNPNAVTVIQTTVTVTQAEVTACPSNQAFTAAQVFFGGHFFNTDTPTPGSSIGDVFAAVFLTRIPSDPANQLLARFQVFECLDNSCANTRNLDSRNLGTVATDQQLTLLLQWDRLDHQFIFQLNADPKIISSYSVTDTAMPGAAQKAFNVGGGVANCTATPRPTVLTNALLANVFVNQSAVP